MKCPNCDFIEKDEAFGQPPTCPKCGAIYEKARRLRELKEMHAKKLQAAAEKKAKEQQAAEQQAAEQASENATVENGQQAHQEVKAEESISASISAGIAEARAERQREADEIASRGTQEVVITDVQIPFLSLTVLLFKIMVAAIPAAIAFYIFMLIVLGVIKEMG